MSQCSTIFHKDLYIPHILFFSLLLGSSNEMSLHLNFEHFQSIFYTKFKRLRGVKPEVCANSDYTKLPGLFLAIPVRSSFVTQVALVVVQYQNV